MARTKVLLFAFSLLTAFPAKAGFQWSPPEQNPTSQYVAPQDIPAPAAPVPAMDEIPVLAEPAEEPAIPAPVLQPEPLTQDDVMLDVEPAVPAPASQPVMKHITVSPEPQPMPEQRIPAVPAAIEEPAQKSQVTAPAFEPASQAPSLLLQDRAPQMTIQATPPLYTHAVGFGSDLPLALALQQVVPAGYAYAFGPGVNPGVRVSWSGGKPWNIVVGEMIQPLGLRGIIHGKTLQIRSASHNITPAPVKPEVLMPLAPPAPAESHMRPVPAAPEPSMDPSPAEIAIMPETMPQEPIIKRQSVIDPGQREIFDRDPGPVNLVSEDMVLMPSFEPAAGIETEDNISPASAPVDQKVFGGRSAADFWEVQAGSSLKETLQDWSEQARIDLRWESEKDFTIEKNIMVHDTFSGALKTLMADAMPLDGPAISFVEATDAQSLSTLVIR